MSDTKSFKQTIAIFFHKERLYIFLTLFLLLTPFLFAGSSDDASAVDRTASEIVSSGEIEISEGMFRAALQEGCLSAHALVLLIGIFIGGCGLGLIFLFQFVLRSVRKKMILDISSREYTAPWHISDCVRVIILLMSVGHFLSIIEAVLIGLTNVPLPAEHTLLMINTAIFDCVGLAIIIGFIRKKYGVRSNVLGMRRVPNMMNNIVTGYKAYITVLPVLVVVLIVTMAIVKYVHYEPPPQPIFDLFYGTQNMALMWFAVVFVALAGPFIEEVFFRGFVYVALQKRIGKRAAMVITAVCFSALHTNVIGFVPIFLLGMMLVYLYERTGSLIPSIVVHMTHNAALTILVLIVRDLTTMV